MNSETQNITTICNGRALYKYAKPGMYFIIDKPYICRKLFEETEILSRKYSSFGNKQFDIVNIEKWRKITGNIMNDDDNIMDLLRTIDSILEDS